MVKKYKTCRHVTAIGQNVVYTSLNCPLANHLRGVLIVAKSQCTACRAWERKSNDQGTIESAAFKEGCNSLS